MTAAPRITATLAALLLTTAMAVTACTPTAGPLGTPATPGVSAEPSDLPAPSDVAPGSPAASPSSSAAPSETPSEAPTASPATGPSGTPSPATPRPTTGPTPTASPAGSTIVRAYFFLGSFTGNEGLVPVLREIPATRGVAAAAMRALLAGPQGAELEGSPAMYSAIPDGTRLLGVTIEDGTATVDLSGKFATGGGSFSVMGRLAQVVYTLTQFSSVDRVLFELDGVRVTSFGSEGIVLDGPVNRADYRELLPAIFVDRPAWGAAAGNPARITGIANVFEATFQVELLDARGHVIADEVVTASCGTGCWGTFRIDLDYEVGRAQYGTLRVFALSARDGAREHVTEYRVWLTP